MSNRIRKRSGFLKHLTIKNCDKTFRKSILKICRRRFDVWLTSLSSQKVKDKKCLNTKKDKRRWNVLKQRALCEWNQSSVKTRIAQLDEEHLINETVTFSLALFENAELAFFEEACIPMGCQKVAFMWTKNILWSSLKHELTSSPWQQQQWYNSPAFDSLISHLLRPKASTARVIWLC